MLILAGVGAGPSGSYESIATTTVGSGGTATVTFSSIPSTFKHLQVRAIMKNSSTNDGCRLRFNSDTASNYSLHYLYGDGATAQASALANWTIVPFGVSAPSTAANVFSAAVLDILDYADTNKYKTTRSLCGYDTNGGGYVTLASGNWRSTSAINRIDIVWDAGNSAQYSSFALYGIKG